MELENSTLHYSSKLTTAKSVDNSSINSIESTLCE